MNDFEKMVEVYSETGGEPDAFKNVDAAHLVVSENRVVGAHLVPGLDMDVEEMTDGIRAFIVITRGSRIVKPVHLCFGVLPEQGLQKIDMQVRVEDGAAVSLKAHCTFPNAVKVRHMMDAEIVLGDRAEYRYEETHFHGTNGGVEVVPRSKIILGEHSLFTTLFSLTAGRAGVIDMDYDTELGAHSAVEMIARVNGSADDSIKIREAGVLKGERSRGVLKTRVALSGSATAEVYSELIALGAKSRGHVDCTEIIREDARAKAVPVVDVRHPEAQVTHEAAIGGVNLTQLETLMARGLDEEEATEVIVQGMLRG